MASGLKRLVGSSAIVTSATVITAACSIMSLALNTRALGIQQFGMLALVQAFVSFISGLATFDNWQPIVRLGVRSPDKLGLVLGSGVLLDVCASLTAAIVAGALMALFATELGFGAVAPLALLPYCLSLLAGVGGTPKGYFRLEGRFDLLAQNQIATGVLQLLGSATLWLLEAPLDAYLVVLGIAAAVPGISLLSRMIFSLQTRKIALVKPWGSPSRRRYLRTVLRMAGGNSMLSTFTTSRHQISLFIVSAVAGAAAAGLFAAASRCANAITKIFVPISQVIFPEILRLRTERTPEQVRRAMKRITLYAAGMALLIAVGGALGSEQVVTVAAGTAFREAAPLFGLLLAAELVLWAGFHFNPFLLSTIGQAPLLKMNFGVATLMVLFNLVAAFHFGALGGALAVLVGALLSYAGLFGLVQRQLARSGQ